MTTPVIMVDGISLDVPVIQQRFPGYPVAGYVTGGYPVEWSPLQFALFSRKIRIAQSPVLAADDESQARVLDVETGAATPGDWPEFYASRTDKARATCYCDLSNVPLVIAACEAKETPLPARWWLAWYWQRPSFPAMSEVLAELLTLTGVQLDPHTLWATQFAAYGQWDLSVVYGTPDFSRR
jgi:hypothetical protein